MPARSAVRVGLAEVLEDKAAKLPVGTAVICQRYVSDWLLASRLALPSKVTKLPTDTFCVTPAWATGAVLGVLQPAPGKMPSTAEQPPLPPPPQATKRDVSRAANETRNVVFMEVFMGVLMMMFRGVFTCKENAKCRCSRGNASPCCCTGLRRHRSGRRPTRCRPFPKRARRGR